MSVATDDFVRRLPKCEQHLHLEGSLRLPTIELLAARHGIDVGDRPNLAERYRILRLPGVPDAVHARPRRDAYRRRLRRRHRRACDRARRTTRTLRRGHDDRVLAHVSGHPDRGLLRGTRRRPAPRAACTMSNSHGSSTSHREFEPPDEHFTARFVTGPNAPEGLVAIGLGGPELGSDPRKYADSFAIARAEGLGSVPHAGEMDGPDSVRGALDALHADRIGHGIRAVEDDALVRRLVDSAVPLEVSLSSNVLLGACRVARRASGSRARALRRDRHLQHRRPGVLLDDAHRRVAAGARPSRPRRACPPRAPKHRSRDVVRADRAEAKAPSRDRGILRLTMLLCRTRCGPGYPARGRSPLRPVRSAPLRSRRRAATDPRALLLLRPGT